MTAKNDRARWKILAVAAGGAMAIALGAGDAVAAPARAATLDPTVAPGGNFNLSV